MKKQSGIKVMKMKVNVKIIGKTSVRETARNTIL